MKDPRAPGDSDSVECETDIRAVALAILRGVITPEEGRTAVFGRTEPKPVSETLHLRPEIIAEAREPLPAEAAGLFKSLFEQPDPEALRAEDETLAKLLVAQQLVSPEQAEECLGIQRRLHEHGFKPIPRLGDLLVRRGVLAPGRIASSLVGPTPQEVLAAANDPANCIGRYVRTRKLGEGGMGEVWRAWDRELSRWVALKFLKGKDRDELARFRREAQTAAKLSHPNIAAIYEAQDTFIAMQLVEGQTLATFPRDNAREIVEIVRDVALALDHAHEQGVIHRDVKPENIMVESGRPLRVWVMDFGLAKQMTVEAQLSASGQILGTPAYMSPEQAIGHRVDRRGDVYSLGATLYDLLTDRPPFVADDLFHTIRKILESEPRPVKRDADLNTIVMKCLEKDPGRRYATARELAEDLDRWLRGEPIHAHPPSAMYRLRKKVARNPWAWSLAGAAAMAVLVGLVAVVVLLRKGDEQSQVSDLVLRMERSYDQGDFERIPPLIEEALRIDPSNAQAKYWRSRLLLREYQKRRGVPQARVIRGVVEIEPLREETGKERRLRAEIESGFGGSPLSRGIFALWAGGYAQAIRELDKIEKGSPAKWEAEFYAGVAHYLQGEFVLACDRMEGHEDRDPAVIRPVYLRCLLAAAQDLELRGQDREAERLYHGALRFDDDPAAHAEAVVGWGRFKARRGEDPREDYQDALDRLPKEARTARGDLLLALAEFKRSRGSLDLENPAEYREAIDAYGEGEPLRRADAYMKRFEYMQAHGRADLRDLERARDDYARARAGNPKLLDAAIGEWISTRELRKEEGVAVFQECVDRMSALLRDHPDHFVVLVARGEAFVHLAYALEREQKDAAPAFEAGVKDFQRATSLRSSCGEAHRAAGIALQALEGWYWRKGEDRHGLELIATKHYEEAIRINPKDARAHMLLEILKSNHALRDCKDVRKLIEGAEKTLAGVQRAIDINPHDAECWRMMGTQFVKLAEAHSALGEDPFDWYEKAVRAYERALVCRPAEAYTEFNLGEVHRSIAEHHMDENEDPAPELRKALPRYDAAVRLDPKFADAWAQRGRTRAWLAKLEGVKETRPYDEALEDVERSLRFGKSWVAYFYRAEIRHDRASVIWGSDESLTDLEKAAADAEKAAGIEPRHEKPRYTAGVIRLELGFALKKAGKEHRAQYETAETHFGASIGLDPLHAKAWMLRGVVRASLGKFAEAAPDLRKSIELDPSLRPQAEPWLKKCE